jgi:hypothetical protein
MKRNVIAFSQKKKAVDYWVKAYRDTAMSLVCAMSQADQSNVIYIYMLLWA